MHIAVDLTSETGRPGGITTYWRELFTAMRRVAPECRLTAFGARDLPVPDIFDGPLCACGTGVGGAMTRRLRQQFRLPFLLERGDYDLVHSVNNVSPLFTRRPTVVTIQDVTVRHTPRRFGTLKRRLLSELVPRSARNARRIIVPSEATRRDVLGCAPDVPPDRIAVIPLGVESRFEPEGRPGERERLGHRYALPNRFTLYLGAAEPGKNLGGMFAAMDVLAKRGKPIPPLVIAGSGGWGPIQAELRRRTHDLPIHSIGAIPSEDLPALYRAARVFLFPSLWEGFGLPVLEALACGIPVVTSNRSSLPEVGGDAARLVDPADPENIAEGWWSLWSEDDERHRCRTLGLTHARGFSWERCAERTLEVYESVVRPVGRKVLRDAPAVPKNRLEVPQQLQRQAQ